MVKRKKKGEVEEEKKEKGAYNDGDMYINM
jgi:hypothetical protein